MSVCSNMKLHEENQHVEDVAKLREGQVPVYADESAVKACVCLSKHGSFLTKSATPEKVNFPTGVEGGIWTVAKFPPPPHNANLKTENFFLTSPSSYIF